MYQIQLQVTSNQAQILIHVQSNRLLNPSLAVPVGRPVELGRRGAVRPALHQDHRQDRDHSGRRREVHGQTSEILWRLLRHPLRLLWIYFTACCSWLYAEPKMLFFLSLARFDLEPNRRVVCTRPF